MVLATIMQCTVLCATPSAPNAADAWQDLFVELKNIPYIEHKGGFRMPYYENEVWDESAHEYRSQMAPIVGRAREIAKMEHCDWGLDYSQGLDMVLPHLGNLQKVQHMLHYSMRGEMDMGNTNAAIAEMDSMFRITRHNQETKTLLGSLVTASGFNLAISDKRIVDNANDVEQLETILSSVDQFETFDPFGLRTNIGNEKEIVLNWLKNTENPDFTDFVSMEDQEIDISNLDMDAEIERFSYGMGKMETIFQMTDKEAALKAAEALDVELEEGGLGFLAMMLSPSSKKLLDTAFKSEEVVSDFKQLLRNKIDMLRNPSAATYFLKAVEAYNALDAKERMKAIELGDFSAIEEPLALFLKACSMPSTQISLVESPATPKWIAPLYSIALDCHARGTLEDKESVVAFIGHMSVQDRFAASIVAGKLFSMLQWYEVPVDLKNIPSADAFGLHGSAQSNSQRLKEYFKIDEDWNPSKATVLATTFIIANENGVAKENQEAWDMLIEAIGLPDDDSVIVVILEEWMPSSLQLVELDQEPAFNEMLKEMRDRLMSTIKSTRSTGR